jgi:hypothetical protein
MDIYNPFVKQFPALKFYLEDANNYIAATSAANNIPCAKVYRAFNGANGDEDAGDKGYISPYDPSGVHPGELGHQVIADLFRNLGYATGQTASSAPVLLTEENTNRAAAVDSVTLMRDPCRFSPRAISALTATHALRSSPLTSRFFPMRALPPPSQCKPKTPRTESTRSQSNTPEQFRT